MPTHLTVSLLKHAWQFSEVFPSGHPSVTLLLGCRDRKKTEAVFRKLKDRTKVGRAV